MRRAIERVVREGTVVARSDGTTHAVFPVAISAEEGEALARRVARERPTRPIEIGLGYGVAALFLFQGLLAGGDESSRHLAIDPFQATRFAGCGLQLLEEAGVAARVEHRAEESLLALPQLVREGRSFDFAIVDGNHRFDGVFLDLAQLGRLLAPGSAIFLDDYQLPAVAKAAAFFTRNLGWTLEQISAPDVHHQWAVLRTLAPPLARAFDHFVDF